MSWLPLATESQLQDLNDICSICRVEMSVGSARYTPCGHYFHQDCLLRWFYRSVTCPYCNADLVGDSLDTTDGETTEEEEL